MEKSKDVDLIRSKLDDVNKLIEPYKLAYVSPVNDCLQLEKNCHYMEKEKLDRLVDNVSKDGFLSQLPFGMKRKSDGKYLILSGNHRLKAAIKAKLEFILILYIDEVDRDTQIAYQLSHNALVGRDDAQMLKEIYKEIESIEAKEYTGLNGMNFLDIEKLNVSSINDGDIELTEIKFLFIENRKNDVRAVLSELERLTLDKESAIVVGSFDAFIKTMTEVKKVYGIKSNTIAFGKMIEICKEAMQSIQN